jgi:diguanylate cyclase (GGDEF)-like protein
LSSTKNRLEAIATWGPAPLTSELIFPANECFSLRRGQPYLVEDTHHGLLCQHIRPDSQPVETFCLPMMAQGETLGVLYVSSLHRGRICETKPLAITVAKHIGLALANLKLRETLKNQSLRDPLTKLYNRRYLEESLEREIRLFERRPQPLGIILLEIDNFERFNQKFGQAASELLLREMGMFLPSQIRVSDIVCRYGTEQFLLLLPEASLEITKHRAEQMRHNIKLLSIQYRRQTLDPITISCGLAGFPEHAMTGKALIQAARVSLNRAKAQGGDLTVLYTQ